MIEIDDKISKLLSHYSKDLNISEYGVWQMFGEDPNCDFGGHHHTPSLGYAEGTFLDVLAYASTLPKFYSWGSGGHIKKHTPNVTKIKKGFYSDLINGVFEREQNELKKEKEELEKRLAEVKSKIVK